MLIAPVLIIIGIFMLDIIKLNLPKINIGGESLKKKTKGGWGAMLLGGLIRSCFLSYQWSILFRYAYPSISSRNRRLSLTCNLCYCYGITCNPFAWILAYSVAGLGKFYNRIQIFEKWFRKIVAILFIAVGIYYAIVFYL